MLSEHIITGLITAAVTAFGTWLAYKKTAARSGQKALEAAHRYLDERHQREIDRLGKRIDEVEREHQNCRRDLARLNDEVARLKARDDAKASGVIVADQDGKIVDANLPATGIFHRRREDMIGIDIAELCAPRSRGAHLAAFNRWRVSERPPVRGSIQAWALWPDGTEFTVEVTLGDAYKHADRWVVVALVRRVYTSFVEQIESQ